MIQLFALTSSDDLGFSVSEFIAFSDIVIGLGDKEFSKIFNDVKRLNRNDLSWYL